MNKYFGAFAECTNDYPLIKDTNNRYYDGFEVSPLMAIEISKLDIICAAYSHESYDGCAFVLFRKDGKLYEVNDSHCSCRGLDEWSPEETTKEALLLRDIKWGVWKEYGDQLKEIIRGLE